MKYFFWIQGNSTSRKVHFVCPGERVKSRLSQALTRGACPDLNSRPAVQISNPLPSRYTPWGPETDIILPSTIHFTHQCNRSMIDPGKIQESPIYRNPHLNLSSGSLAFAFLKKSCS